MLLNPLPFLRGDHLKFKITAKTNLAEVILLKSMICKPTLRTHQNPDLHKALL